MQNFNLRAVKRSIKKASFKANRSTKINQSKAIAAAILGL